MVVKARIHAKDRAAARPVTTVAKAKTHAKARAAARPRRTAAKARMVAPRADSSNHQMTLL